MRDAGRNADAGRRRRRCAASPPLSSVLHACTGRSLAPHGRYKDSITSVAARCRALTPSRSLSTALLHSNSLQDDRLLSRAGTAHQERDGYTTSARAMLGDSEDWRPRRKPTTDGKSSQTVESDRADGRKGRRRLPSESALSSLIANTRASFDAWRRRKKVSAPALIPVPPPTAAGTGATSGTVFSHQPSRSVDASGYSSSSDISVSDMELSTVDLRTQRRKPQRRPASTSIDYSFSVSELELSTVDLRRLREQKHRPTLKPSSSMPDMLPREMTSGSVRDGDAALRMATSMTPARPDPLSISYVKHYK